MSVKSFVEGNLEKLADAQLKCKCGLTHKLPVRQMLALSNAANGVNFYIKQLGKKAYFLIEKNVAEVCGERIAAKISKELRSGASSVQGLNVADCREIVGKIPQDTTVLVSVGGKAACQAGKFVSAELNLPLIFVAVIADDDDMLSDRSVLKNGKCIEIFKGSAPQAVFVSVNEAFKLCKDLSAPAALVCCNLLLSLESKFNFISKGVYNCAVADSMIAQSAKEFVPAAVRGLSKNSLESAFTALLRISAAKAISMPGVYDTSFAAVCDLIEGETNLDRTVVAGTVFAALADCFDLVLTNCGILSFAKESDCPDDEILVEKKVKADYSYKNIELNKQSLLEEIHLISKLKTMAQSLCIPDVRITRQVLENALKNAGGYGFEGIIPYGFTAGLL